MIALAIARSIVAIVAVAVLGVLMDWLLKHRLPNWPSQKSQRIVIILCCAAALLAAVSSAIPSDFGQRKNVPVTKLTTTIKLPGAHSPPSVQEQEDNSQQTFIIPTAMTPEQPVRISIPKSGIEIDAPIVLGESEHNLKIGVELLPDFAPPGEPGLIVLGAYNDKFGKIFQKIDKLNPGDLVLIYNARAAHGYSYRVQETRQVKDQTITIHYRSTDSVAILSSAYPYLQDNEFFVVIATATQP